MDSPRKQIKVKNRLRQSEEKQNERKEGRKGGREEGRGEGQMGMDDGHANAYASRSTSTFC